MAITPKKQSSKSTSFGPDLIPGMKLVLAHERCEIPLEQILPKPIEVKAIRKWPILESAVCGIRNVGSFIPSLFMVGIGTVSDTLARKR